MTSDALHAALEAAADRYGAPRPDAPQQALAAVHRRVRRRRTRLVVVSGTTCVAIVVGLVMILTGGRQGGRMVHVAVSPSTVVTTALPPGPDADAWQAGTWSTAAPPPAPFTREAHVFPVDGKLVVLQPGVWRVVDHGPEAGAWAGATYDLATDRWTPIPAAPGGITPTGWAVPVGDRLIVWGRDEHLPVTDRLPVMRAASLDPATNTWTALASPPASIVSTSAVTWTGDRLIVIGMVRDGDDAELQAVAYDPDADVWQVEATFSTEEFSGGMPVRALWTGAEVLVWVDHVPPADGTGWQRIAAYKPGTRAWLALPDDPGRPAMSALAIDQGKVVGVTRSVPCGACVPGTDVVAPVTIDPVDGSWSLGPRLDDPRLAVARSGAILDGASVMAGDAIVGLWPSVDQGEATLAMFDADRDAWSMVPAPSGTMSVGSDTGRFPVTQLVWSDGRLLVWSQPACLDTSDCAMDMRISVFTPG